MDCSKRLPLDVLRKTGDDEGRIKSFRDKDTEALANNHYVKAFDNIQDAARRRLKTLSAAKGISDLAVDGEDFRDVEITDYH